MGEHQRDVELTVLALADGNLDGRQKKKYLSKIVFTYILGYQVDVGHMEAVNLISRCGPSWVTRSSASRLTLSMQPEVLGEADRMVFGPLASRGRADGAYARPRVTWLSRS